MCLNIIEMHNNREANKKIVRGFVMSSNMMPTNLEETINIVKKFRQPLEDMIAVDTEVGGIAVACEFFDVPIVVLKSTTYEVGNQEQFVARERFGIEMSPIIGNLIGHLLLDLASQEQMQ
jgi:nucleoside phosphorylase